MLRFYVLIAGAVLLLLGLVGLASSKGVIAVIQTSPVADLFT